MTLLLLMLPSDHPELRHAMWALQEPSPILLFPPTAPVPTHASSPLQELSPMLLLPSKLH